MEEAIEKVRKNRTIYRAKHIPLDELYTKGELMELEKEFGVAVNEKETISKLSLEAILQNMGINIDQDELTESLKSLKADYKEEDIDYELFVRVVALSLELKNYADNEEMLEEGYEEDVEEEKKWFNQ